MRKVCALLISVVLVLIPGVVTKNVLAEDGGLPPEEYLIQELISERNQALVKGNYDLANELSEEMYGLGLEKTSYEELCGELGMPMPRYRSDNGYTLYERYISDARHNGKDYTYMIIFLTPMNEGSDLYLDGSTTLTNKKSLVAKTANLVQSFVNLVVGFIPKAGAAVSIYDAFKDNYDFFQETSVITDIKANYTWSITEACAFTYLASEVIVNSYIPIGYANDVSL